MTSRWFGSRVCPWLAAVALSLPGGVAVAAPARTALADCSGLSSGVTLVVDFGAFGGGVDVRCAPGDPATGWRALQDAGFAVAGTTRYPATFVCRIDGLPGPAAEPCVNTPPANAYWSYWHASRGGTWVYSELGAAGYDPAPGTVEGWAFGTGSPPGIAVPAAPAPPDPVPTTTTPRGGSTGGPTPGGPVAGGPTPDGPTSDAPAPTTVNPDPAGAPPTGGPSPSGEDSEALPTRKSLVDSSRPSGPAGTVIGVGLIAALAVLATVISWRRRPRAVRGTDVE